MADPLMQAVCCQHGSVREYDEFHKLFREINSQPYNIACFVSSAVGIFGAVYQILPRTGAGNVHHWYWTIVKRGRQIIIWLAFADLLASLGVFFRSAIRLTSPSSMKNITEHSIECIFLAFWIQYFYVVSWFWTMIYAVDMWLALQKRPASMSFYHTLCWLMPAVFTFLGLFTLYSPSVGCFMSAEGEFWRFLPNYIMSYMPMLMVMIANPVLYTMSAHSVHFVVARYLSQYTQKERRVVDLIRIKFGLINLAFYVCWLPNLISSIFLYLLWDSIPRHIIVSMWYLMAILNPLQALFNSLVYKSPHLKIRAPWSSWTSLNEQNEDIERTHLLARRHGSSNSDNLDYVL